MSDEQNQIPPGGFDCMTGEPFTPLAAPDAGDLSDAEFYLRQEGRWRHADAVKQAAATIAALREEVSRLTDNQRQQDSATAYVMERDEKERDALRREVEELKLYGSNAYSQGFRDGVAKSQDTRIRAEAAERELAEWKAAAPSFVVARGAK